MSSLIQRQQIVRASPAHTGTAVEWRVLDGVTPYADALERMETRVAAIAAGTAAEEVLLLEHPPLYTAGTSAPEFDAQALRFPLHQTGRGGQITYHGPGQRVAYVMLDLSRRGQDIRAFVAALEDWIIAALAQFGVHGERREDRVGVWVARPDKPCGPNGEPAEDKIAAIGIRVRRWVSFHGISLNVAPDLCALCRDHALRHRRAASRPHKPRRPWTHRQPGGGRPCPPPDVRGDLRPDRLNQAAFSPAVCCKALSSAASRASGPSCTPSAMMISGSVIPMKAKTERR